MRPAERGTWSSGERGRGRGGDVALVVRGDGASVEGGGGGCAGDDNDDKGPGRIAGVGRVGGLKGMAGCRGIPRPRIDWIPMVEKAEKMEALDNDLETRGASAKDPTDRTGHPRSTRTCTGCRPEKMEKSVERSRCLGKCPMCPNKPADDGERSGEREGACPRMVNKKCWSSWSGDERGSLHDMATSLGHRHWSPRG